MLNIRLFCGTQCSALHRGGKPELKFRTTDEADTAHVVSRYRQLASRDISFLSTSFKPLHSLRAMQARDTAYFESMPSAYSADVFTLPIFRPVHVEWC